MSRHNNKAELIKEIIAQRIVKGWIKDETATIVDETIKLYKLPLDTIQYSRDNICSLK